MKMVRSYSILYYLRDKVSCKFCSNIVDILYDIIAGCDSLIKLYLPHLLLQIDPNCHHPNCRGHFRLNVIDTFPARHAVYVDPDGTK